MEYNYEFLLNEAKKTRDEFMEAKRTQCYPPETHNEIEFIRFWSYKSPILRALLLSEEDEDQFGGESFIEILVEKFHVSTDILFDQCQGRPFDNAKISNEEINDQIKNKIDMIYNDIEEYVSIYVSRIYEPGEDVEYNPFIRDAMIKYKKGGWNSLSQIPKFKEDYRHYCEITPEVQGQINHTIRLYKSMPFTC
jgi:hypothetical protein